MLQQRCYDLEHQLQVAEEEVMGLKAELIELRSSHEDRISSEEEQLSVIGEGAGNACKQVLEQRLAKLKRAFDLHDHMWKEVIDRGLDTKLTVKLEGHHLIKHTMGTKKDFKNIDRIRNWFMYKRHESEGSSGRKLLKNARSFQMQLHRALKRAG